MVRAQNPDTANRFIAIPFSKGPGLIIDAAGFHKNAVLGE